MTEVISVKFKNGVKEYFFDPNGHTVKVGDKVIVEIQKGIEMCTVCRENHTVEDDKIVSPLKKMLRFANKKDFERIEENHKKEQEAFKICEKKIEEHKLEMKLTRVEYSLDASQIVFFFTAEGRVDFRELVKDLASEFHTRIELRQIGVRDEAKMLGGIGICGQPYCCKRFLKDFEAVSIKMAKEQGLSLNPTKVSGSCGRLMCCLKYEQNAYEYLSSVTPRTGSQVKTPDGTATVVDSNLISGNLTVKLTDTESAMPFKIHRDEVKSLSSKGKHHKNPHEND